MELEFNLRATESVNVFGGAGLTQANFGRNSRSSGANVSGHDLPYALISPTTPAHSIR